MTGHFQDMNSFVACILVQAYVDGFLPACATCRTGFDCPTTERALGTKDEAEMWVVSPSDAPRGFQQEMEQLCAWFMGIKRQDGDRQKHLLAGSPLKLQLENETRAHMEATSVLEDQLA